MKATSAVRLMPATRQSVAPLMTVTTPSDSGTGSHPNRMQGNSTFHISNRAKTNDSSARAPLEPANAIKNKPNTATSSHSVSRR